ncbi:MAG: hypothetical protein J0L96_17940 [Anaerolineae bacterium]|nr:hypothetical protein [Anaerolineae bacterium]
MQIDHDTIMLLVGAGIGLSSSLLTSLFQAWLSKREFNRQKEYEESIELKKITLPTISEIQWYSKKLSETDKERIRKELSNNKDMALQSNTSFIYWLWNSVLFHVLEFAKKQFALFLFIVLVVVSALGYMIYKAIIFVSNPSLLLLNFIVTIVSFILVQMVAKQLRSKWRNDFLSIKRDKKGNYLCPKCGLPFKTDNDTYTHIKNWHSQ